MPDTFACLDRSMSLLLTDNASPGSSDGMMLGFLVEEGGTEKLVILVISLILLTESLDRKQSTALFISTMYTFLFFIVISVKKCIISEERLVLERYSIDYM